jgi:type I restriction enzyme S subunit
MVGYLKAKSSGSIFKSIVGNDIRLTPLIIPESDLIEKYDDQISNLFERILIGLKENESLIELRDWLLPMLMNGQVRVMGGEVEIKMAAEPSAGYGDK